ncbi:MAG: Aminopeptidase protein [Berkelbacteria bacterium GW2011_GWA2_35_9]|uniref:Aminopeptidase protein n=1 Tax=Berkelbacteria bacterium GW2011_GWA2_35_9 TaxID=1618333 RepID=A0A0G0G9L8_9BACT|nr:MAG: Aminopeptidase protein [Berkelbacteria bacterium GW2011_GWA2_35_9]
MSDIRTKKLAKLVVNYSLQVKRNENVVINGSTEAEKFIVELYKAVITAGAHPILRLTLPELGYFYYKHAQDHQILKFPDHFDYMVKNAQKYISIDTTPNTKDFSNIDPKKIVNRSKVTQPITNYIVNEHGKINRITVGFPCLALAQEASMSLSEYENFVFRACLQDWKTLGEMMDRILNKFKKGKKIHLVGENIDLSFDINGDKAIADKGEENMPGGEIFMAPVRESTKGWVKFEYPATKSDKEICDIFLEFKNGKVVKSSASKNSKYLREILNTDENSSYLGEFGIGLNPNINKFTNNLLFDEKIGGTIHLALGMAYKANGGGNDSAVHWDIVKNMKKARIELDGMVAQENGQWKI